MAIINMRHCKYEIVIVIRKRNQIVNLILLEFECLNDMLNLHTQQIHQKHLIINSHHNLILTNT
jgi:hypothetical protein